MDYFIIVNPLTSLLFQQFNCSGGRSWVNQSSLFLWVSFLLDFWIDQVRVSFFFFFFFRLGRLFFGDVASMFQRVGFLPWFIHPVHRAFDCCRKLSLNSQPMGDGPAEGFFFLFLSQLLRISTRVFSDRHWNCWPIGICRANVDSEHQHLD